MLCILSEQLCAIHHLFWSHNSEEACHSFQETIAHERSHPEDFCKKDAAQGKMLLVLNPSNRQRQQIVQEMNLYMQCQNLQILLLDLSIPFLKQLYTISLHTHKSRRKNFSVK